VSKDKVNCSELKISTWGGEEGLVIWSSFVVLCLFFNNRVIWVKVLNVIIFQGFQFRAVHCADRIIAHQSGTWLHQLLFHLSQYFPLFHI